MAAVEPLLRGESGGSGSTITIDAGGGGGGSKIDGGGRQPQRTLTLLPLAALIFFEVSGGPYGVEDAVGAAGPFWALLGFVTFPLIWSVPEALVCAELTGLFPENAGYVAWVTEAFGPFAGFVEGWCSWWSGAIDNAIYPGLFLQYVRQLSGGDASSGGGGGPAGWLDDRGHFLLALLALNVLLTYLNWRGLEFVGRAATVLVVLAVSPFLAMTVLAVPRLDLSRLAGRRAQPDWGLMINTLMWNLNYWDSASTLSGEVIRPRTTIPRALALTVVIVVCVYTVPIVVGCALVPGGGADSGPGSSGGAGSQSFTSDLGAPAPDTVTHGGSGGGGGGEWEQWQDGYFTTVAEEIGGKWLGVWLLAAAALSAAGQYLAEMSSNSFQLEGMAQRKQLPASLRFGRRSRHGTPSSGILASFVICIVMGVTEIEMVIEATNCLYCVAALLEFAAFLRLRCRHGGHRQGGEGGGGGGGGGSGSLQAGGYQQPQQPELEAQQPVSQQQQEEEGERFVIPLGTFGCFLMLAPAAGFIVVVLCLAAPATTLLGSCIVLAAPVAYWLAGMAPTVVR